MIEKKDWVLAEKMFNDLNKTADNQIVNAEINKEIYSWIFPKIKHIISKFPEDIKEEDDPMPESFKEVVGAIK